MAIKRQAEDFIVEERLAPAFEAGIVPRRGPYVVYRLEKRGLSTPEAVAQVQEALACKPGDIAFAGLKDKHAVTAQTITVRWAASRGEPPPRKVDRPAFSLRGLGFAAEPITSRQIIGNHFEIVVRDLSAAEAWGLEVRARQLALPREAASPGERLLLVNYFGAQRFGSVHAGQAFTARQLIAGKFEAALRQILLSPHPQETRRVREFKETLKRYWGRWEAAIPKLPALPERRVVEHLAEDPQDYRGAFSRLPYIVQAMQIEAYQSYLWNRIASRLVIEQCGAAGDAADSTGLTAPDRIVREIYFPVPSAVPESLRKVNLPLFGRQTRLAEPWRGAAEAVLADEGLELGALKVPGRERPWFGQSQRSLFVEARDFMLGPIEPDDRGQRPGAKKRAVAFDLPRGAYATVVLAALGEVEAESPR